MKKLVFLLAACILALATYSCAPYDDTGIKDELSSLKNRVASLEEQMKTANGNISGLQEIVNALKNKEMISSVTETDDAWALKFANGTTVTISKVTSPVVGVKQDSDGIYYWTMDGKWLLDAKGNKMPVSGKDGKDGKNGEDGKDGKDAVAPQLKIEDGYWMISTDNGATWKQLAKADGELGDAIKNVAWDDGYVYITFGDDYIITLPKVNLSNVLKKIQSIQYVPDYDDGKITVNSALVHYGTDAILFDQPTEITYQFLPAQYAGDIAAQIRELCQDQKLKGMPLETLFFLLSKEFPDNPEDVEGTELREVLKECGITNGLVAWFDVRKVNTRSGSGDKPVKYCMHILDVVSADNNSGEITFKVLPINIASESFAASGLEPRYDIGMTDNKGSYIQGWDPDADAFFGCTGIFRAEDPLNTDYTFSVPVWKLSDLQAWQGRSAFAVQLRLYQFQDFLTDGKDEYGQPVYSDFENELASPYTTLYPNILEPIEMLPGAYVTGPDGDPVPVNGEEHQYLPYNVLRQDGTPKEPGYRTILNGVMPAFVINGKTVTAEEAYKMGYKVYGSGVWWDSFSYSSASLEDLVIGTEQVYAEVEMNPEKSEAERKAAIGGKITGKYIIKTPFGNTECSGTVEITDGSGTPDPGPATDEGYNLMHLKYYTFNSKTSGDSMTKDDFSSNDGSVEWWTRCSPAYYTSLLDPTAAPTGPDNRISFRHVLADYCPYPVNLGELAFNIVDANDKVVDEAEIQKKGLMVKFEYSDGNLGAKSLPDLCQTYDLKYYNDLWQDNTTFLYQTNEMPFIKMKARLFQYSGNDAVELPTRFTTPKASVQYPSEMLDYSSFALVNWIPFRALTSDDIDVSLDQHIVYHIPLAQSLNLRDSRPGEISYFVIHDGEWVVGNVTDYDAQKGTFSSTSGGQPNGYLQDVTSREAYHLGSLEFEIDKSGVPNPFNKKVSVVYSMNGLDFFSEPIPGATPYLKFDYTSEAKLVGTIDIPVHVELPNPWQPALKSNFTVHLTGKDDNPTGGGGGSNPLTAAWVGSWSVQRGQALPGTTYQYDTWVITEKEPGVSLRIQGVTSFTDPEFDIEATVTPDGDLVVSSQYTGGVVQSGTVGDMQVFLTGQYGNPDDNSFCDEADNVIFIGHLEKEGNAADLEPGMYLSPTQGSTPFINIRFYGLYKTAATPYGSYFWDGYESPLPQTIVRMTTN